MNSPAEKRTMKPKTRSTVILLCGMVFICLLAVSVNQIFSIQQARSAAFSEYSRLQKQFSIALQPLSEEEGAETSQATVNGLREINPDFAGWLLLPDAGIDYPIVRGIDNDRYLRITFEGNANPAGSIFMDAGNEKEFASRHVILYGHNMQNGTMFGKLYLYLDAEYREENPIISVTTADGELLRYIIFDAKIVTIEDPCYQIEFKNEAAFKEYSDGLNAPSGTPSLLTLSTCAERGDQDERIVVHAALMSEGSALSYNNIDQKPAAGK